MQALHFTIHINAPTKKVWDTMIHHPTYEQRTAAFSEGSSYQGSRDQGSDMMFGDGSGQGMLARVAENRLYEYISLQHLGEKMLNQETQQIETKMYEIAVFENYTFTAVGDNETKLDVALSAIPEEYAEMMNDMRPKALQLLKNLCE